LAKNIPQYVLDALGASEITFGFLFKFTDGTNDYRYTDFDLDIWSDADGSLEKYSSIGFGFDSINYSMGQIVDDASIRIDNLNSVMTSIFGGDNIQGNKASLWACIITDSTSNNIYTISLFGGYLDSFDLDETELRLKISSLFSSWHQTSFSKYGSSCRWKVFKGTECRYAGTESYCDRTYSKCLYLGNEEHYGGFRFCADVENRTIWWGPNPKERQAEG
jgi:hypothetical protein